MKEFSTPVMIIGNAPHFPSYMEPYLPRMPLIALDGGLHFIEEAGEVAELLIGDMDSISTRNHRAAREVIALAEQDHNDFEKALYSVRAPLMVGAALLGGRSDQHYASLHLCAKYHRQQPIILCGDEDVVLVTSGRTALSLEAGRLCSVLPLAPVTFAVSDGLLWSIAGQELTLGGLISSSNELAADELILEPAPSYESTPYILTFDAALLPHLIEALS